jgi:predicted O-linked N-acetylglucosamine transferase (SPINDLY family)
MTTVGRNDPCPCGSGRKFKKCCNVSPAPGVDSRLQAALLHFEAQRPAEAAAAADALLRDHPDHPDGLHLSGLIARHLGDLERSRERIGAAIRRDPRNPAYHNSLGILLAQQRRGDAAIESFRTALSLRPGYPQALNNLANELLGAQELDEAETCYRELLALNPEAALTHVNLARLLQAQCRLEEASFHYRRALVLEPSNALAHDGLMLNLLYEPAMTAAELVAAARSFGALAQDTCGATPQSFANSAAPERRLRVGYVSADLRRHSVAYFFEPILAHHDHAQFEVFCYSAGVIRDGVTERLQDMADHWVPVHNLTDAGLAERVRADRIDILVDLAGHTSGNRLFAFARRPAPIQIGWIGYPATTGLMSMDFRLTDPIADPPDEDAALDTERLIRLPRTCLCYRPAAESPSVAPAPVLREGYVTFGSLNAPAKHNSRLLGVWAEILSAVPGSRLLLRGRGLAGGRLRASILAIFAERGIPADRIRLLPHESDDIAHLRRYGDIDIALDPFPYNGVTTSCEALWMGVPVITLRGQRHSARMCASILTNAGMGEMIADTVEEYQSLAVRWSADPARLSALRAGLRERVSATALRDEAGVTREVEAAYRRLWRTWCSGIRPPRPPSPVGDP